MFVLASLMALAAAGAALDLTGGRTEEDDEDLADLPPTLGEADMGEVGDISAGSSEEAGTDPAAGTPDPERPVSGEEAGDEVIEGGPGADNLFGGTGNDTITAGAGDDWVQGDGTYDAAGADEIRGGAGNDSLAGQGGHDIIWGDEGDDTIHGGEGQDTLFGGSGNDWLSGNDGDDVLVSGGGADDLDGGRGADHLVGDSDPDTVWMHGGTGDDTLAPGAGDFAEGQDGADQFVLQQTPGALPVIADFDAAEDRLVLHLPDSIAQDARVDLAEDEDGTVLITINGDAIGRMLQAGGLAAQDILIVRLPG
ncbi:calcium-binding protein [Paracoccus sp. SSK6]|uniref:calcium-binding protein n=1 Tax=Paracoccus sp. SSK6 TaxID=3143131 RepID=UPI00321C296C